MHLVDIKILDGRFYQDFTLPAYATPGSAGLDLRAMLFEPLTLLANQTALIPSGIAIHIDNPSVAAVILPRSGLGHNKGLVLGNLTGLIDSDYQGELKISLWNRSNEAHVIQPGDRIAQLVFIPVLQPKLNIVDNFGQTERGEQGFGSTGTA